MLAPGTVGPGTAGQGKFGFSQSGTYQTKISGGQTFAAEVLVDDVSTYRQAAGGNARPGLVFTLIQYYGALYLQDDFKTLQNLTLLCRCLFSAVGRSLQPSRPQHGDE